MKRTLTGIVALFFTLCITCPAVVNAQAAEDMSRPTRLERKADRTFIRGFHSRAMELNSRAESKLPAGSVERSRLQLKMARLYTLLQRYDEAIEYYDEVRGSADTLLSIEDVCLFIDNLRLVGDFQRAEVVARTFAFMNPYSRNQRYMNILNGLTSKQHYYGKGDADYMVRLYEHSTSEPEYWVGNFDGEPFYALSHSVLQDPLKVFYYRTQYMKYSDGGSRGVDKLRTIPRELQTGPVAFSPDNTMMVATGIDYSFQDRIHSLDQLRGLFPTQLFYSVIDAQRNGWGAFLPLFDYQEGYSYAHPAFSADGKSVVFSSDCPGGYGGMDLYICHWNDETFTWGEPVNLGKDVNTEGDEIYPLVWGGRLYFSSNGLEGFGGYDIYHIALRGSMTLPGSIAHYPFPINTSANDFGLRLDGGDVAYFVSDRRGLVGRDDIYTFNVSANSLSSDFSIGVSDQYSALSGNLSLINGMKRANNSIADRTLFEKPENGELILSVYFDFDKSIITAEYRDKLNGLIRDRGISSLDAVSVVGYADELGGDAYNQRLSERRAEAVADFLAKGGFRPEMYVEGRGRQTLSPEELTEAMQSNNIGTVANPETGRYLSIMDRIRINSRLRRVDIFAKELR